MLDPGHGTSVMGVMTMGNIVSRPGLEPTSGIPGQCATITPHRLPDVTTKPMPTCLCSSLPQISAHTQTYIYIYIYIAVFP